MDRTTFVLAAFSSLFLLGLGVFLFFSFPYLIPLAISLMGGSLLLLGIFFGIAACLSLSDRLSALGLESSQDLEDPKSSEEEEGRS